MSSSDEDAIHRPGRSGASGHQSVDNEQNEAPTAPDEAPASNMNGDEDEDADLFGSDEPDAEAGNDEQPPRALDDEELDSGDDMDRHDRAGDRMDYEDAADDQFRETVNIMDMSLSRAPEPVGSNGEVYSMRVPNFLSVETEEFNPETYVAPPYSTAATSLCWRHDPNDDSLLEANSRIIRWEDGSMTLQLASAPGEQYRVSTKPLAPVSKSGDYDPKLDSHVYLGAAAEASSVFRLTSHVTQGLSVVPSTMETDDAVQRLQESLAAASRGGKKTADGSAPVIEVKEDPELAKRQAELAEREKLKAARRRQQLADRELDRGNRVGVSRRTGGAGLTVGGLEDDDGMLTIRAKKPKSRRPNRRGEIHTDDEDDYDRPRRTREDEYDEDDGFLVDSDEEPEVADGGDEEDELEDADMDAEGEEDDLPAGRPATKERPSSPKRKAPEPEAVPGEPGSPPTRKKNRYVVDDDEDE